MVAPLRISPAKDAIAKARRKESILSDDFIRARIVTMASAYDHPKRIGRDELLLVRRANVRQESFFYDLSPTKYV
jgi:hypothetical protein